MKQNKGIAPVIVILIALGIIAVGGGTYVAQKNKEKGPKVEINNTPGENKEATNESENQNMPTTGSQTGLGQSGRCPTFALSKTEWEALLPEIRKVFKTQNSLFESDRSASIVKVGDITGDCTNEALVNMGWGGASNDAFGIVMYENSKVISPKVKKMDGKINSDVGFLNGGSVRHEEKGEFIDGIGYYTLNKTNDENGNPDSCVVGAYKWNLGTKMFEYNQGLTNQWQTDLCGKENEKIVSKCDPNSPSSITILSPNGGETYTAGQKIAVKWKSCNVAENSITIMLIKHNSSTPYLQKEEEHSDTGFSFRNYSRADDGTEQITLPSSMNAVITSGQHYFISIAGLDDNARGSSYPPRDYSNSLFTINSPAISTTLPTPYISSSHWPPVINNSSATYTCQVGQNTSDPEVTDQTVEKNINGRMFCIHTVSSYGMNHWSNTYTYTTANGSGIKTTTFSLTIGNCGVFLPDTTLTVCEQAKASFDLDAAIASLM